VEHKQTKVRFFYIHLYSLYSASKKFCLYLQLFATYYTLRISTNNILRHYFHRQI